MKKIPLTQDRFALVDDSDFEWLNQWKWYYHSTGYAMRMEWTPMVRGKRSGRLIRMHRQIMGEPKGMEVDHEDLDGLNNQRSNLRLATHQQNMYNRKLQSNNKSGFIGVSWSKVTNKWYACIDLGHRRSKSLGFYDTPKEAAQIYNIAAKELRGDFARLNEL